MTDKKTKVKWLTVGFAVVLLSFAMLFSPYAMMGARNGILICLSTLIPSLFPFMILSLFVSLTPLSHYFGKVLSPVIRRVFHLSEKYAFVIFFSLIGGFPIGAKILSDMLQRKETSPKTVERMLCFCVCSGPAFLIGTVGIGMFSSAMAGGLIYLSQLISAFLIAVITATNKPIPARYYLSDTGSGVASALVQAITNATYSMLHVCGFVVAFASVIAVLEGTGILNRMVAALISVGGLSFVDGNLLESALTGMLEVTSGCVKAGALLLPQSAIPLIAFLTGFGGISVFCQIISCFHGERISFRAFWIARICNGLLSSLLCMVSLRLFPLSITTATNTAQPIMEMNSNSLLFTVCMLTMCSILILTFVGSQESSHKINP